MRAELLALALTGPLLLAGCAGSGDGDGLNPEVESSGWSVQATYPNKTTRTYSVTSDPDLADTDGDGLNDFQEWQEGVDPRAIDTDHDRLLDGPKQCPEAGSDLAQAVLEEQIVEHPNEPGCYLGEAPFELDGMSVNTTPNDAHTDDSQRIGDGLTDSEELVGWNVSVGGRTYHVRSNPSLNAPDSDNDGLHDGLERKLSTDPQNKDTDGDGVGDFQDAAPLGNLVVTVELKRIDVKQDKQVGGGANLRMDVRLDDGSKSAGPKSVPSGTSRPRMQLTFDVPDQGETVEGEPYAAGHWTGETSIAFWHEGSGSDDPIRVKGGSSNQNVLQLRYDAFDDEWSGDAEGGTSSGPDADVRIDLDSRVETE